jgi:hypothetical protein
MTMPRVQTVTDTAPARDDRAPRRDEPAAPPRRSWLREFLVAPFKDLDDRVLENR